MRNATWLNAAKRCAALMVALSCLCAPAAALSLFEEPTGIPEQSEEYKKGLALHDEKKYDEARPFYEAGAEKGDPWCINALGEYYNEGWGGLQRDDERAAELIGKAADMNLPLANYYMGLLCLSGIGIPQDAQKGSEFLAKAAETDEPGLLYTLGKDYLDGLNGVRQDAEKGIELLTRSAELNFPEANLDLGGLYESGTFVEQNNHTALNYYKRAKELGNEKVDDKINKLEFLAMVPVQSEDYEKGVELFKADKKDDARIFFEAGAAKGDPWCMNMLGSFYKEGWGGLRKDSTRAVEWITKAAEQNLPEAWTNLGLHYLNGDGVRTDSKKAAELFTKAAEQDETLAIYNLGYCYLKGYGVDKDAKRGIELMTKAAEMEYLVALSNLGFCYLNGINNVPQNIQKGIEFLTKAAELDDPDANLKLGNCYATGRYVERDLQTARGYYEKAKKLGVEKADKGLYGLDHLPDFFVEPEQLVWDYRKNKEAADKKYEGHTVRLSGVITEIKEDDDLLSLLFVVPGEGSVMCNFEYILGSDDERGQKARLQEARALKKGEWVTVQGEVGGMWGEWWIQRCWIVCTD